jgi:NADPH:quinone reductase-like Zn-dependent oxidoreductase
VPIIPGHEFSGEVAALGEGVTGLSVGDTVYGMNDWFQDGAQAEYCLARPADIAAKPAKIDHVHAALIPISALTAWQGLFDHARLAGGQHVLIHGAAGGVGSFAVQFAHAHGARVSATAGAYNLNFVRNLGADQVIDYRAERFEERVQGVDVVFDTVGGDTLRRSWDVLKSGGRMVTIAVSEEASQDERTQKAFFIVEPKRTELEEIAGRIDGGEIRPILGAEFPLADAQAAYQHKPIRGKAVLRVSQSE